MEGINIRCQTCRDIIYQHVEGDGPGMGDVDEMFCMCCKQTTTFEVVELVPE